MQKIGAMLDRYPKSIGLIAGGMSATGFAPLNLWMLTLLCLALLMHLVASAESGKRAFLIGWLFGVGHFSIGNNWIATAFTYQSAMPAWLGWIAVVLLALYLAVYPALAVWGAWWLTKVANPPQNGEGNHPKDGGGARAESPDIEGSGHTAGAPPPASLVPLPVPGRISLSFILAFAGCWIVAEWLRSWVFTGFAWNPLAATMLKDFDGPPLIRWVGTYGASGLLAFIVGMFMWTWHFLKHDREIHDIGKRFAIWIFAPMVWMAPITLLDQLSSNGDLASRSASTRLTIVQPNISQIDKYKTAYEAVNFTRLARLSRPKDNQPRLLLWPEAAIPWWLEDGYSPGAYWNQPGGTAAGTRAVLSRQLGPDDVLLTGADRLEFDATGKLAGARNSVFAIDAKGAIRAIYDKAHLVPYGEYLALRWLLEPLGATRLVPGDLDFWPGPGPRTLDLGVGKPKVGMQICYEIIFSGQVVDRTNRPDFILNPSNDSWFGSWGSPQFLAQARLRAIEEGLPVVRVTPTGISAVVDSDGSVMESLPHGHAGRIDTQLPLAKASTPFARHGNVLPLTFAALLIILSFLPLATARLSR